MEWRSISAESPTTDFFRFLVELQSSQGSLSIIVTFALKQTVLANPGQNVDGQNVDGQNVDNFGNIGQNVDGQNVDSKKKRSTICYLIKILLSFV